MDNDTGRVASPPGSQGSAPQPAAPSSPIGADPSRAPVFVFGSNLAGRHGAGAAKFAMHRRGATYGVGEGRTGNAYALPTKDGALRTLHLDEIAFRVRRFIQYARDNPALLFQVTPVGCGLAGYKRSQIAPMFADAPSNCWFADEHGKDWRP